MQDHTKYRISEVIVQLWDYYIPTLLVVGTIANVLCIFVSFRTEIKNMVSRYYFIAMTICNEVSLVCTAVLWIIRKIDMNFFLDSVCALSMYIPMGVQFLSMYFVLAFMIERYKAVRFPPHRENISKTKITTLAITIAGIMLPVVSFCIRGKYCFAMISPEYSNFYIFVGITEIIVSNVAPCIIIIVLSLRMSAMTREPASMGSMLTNSTNGTYQVPSDQQNSSTVSVKEMRITKMLLMVAITFGCANLIPNLIALLFVIQKNWATGFSYGMIMHFYYFLSCTIVAMNLFTCCLVNQDFRQATFDIIFCRRQTYSTAPQTVLYTHANPESNVTPLMTSATGV